MYVCLSACLSISLCVCLVIDMLIDKRSPVGVPATNVYVFGRLSADSPMAGHTEMKELAYKCDGLKYPDRISSRRLRNYIATKCHVSSYIHVCAKYVMCII